MQMFDRKDDPSIFSNPTVKEVAEKLGKSPAQVILPALPLTAAHLHASGALIVLTTSAYQQFAPVLVITRRVTAEHNALIQVVLRWGLQRGTVVIPKASTDEHLKVRMRMGL
jgi:diketogulonate reductase-like aldo/keto reductase